MVGPRFSPPCSLSASSALQLRRRGVAVAAVRGYLDSATQFFRDVEMCDDRMKILHGFCRAGGDGTYGCCSPSWRRRRGVFDISLALRSCGVGYCLRAEALIRCRIDVMAVSSTSLLCWEHPVWRHPVWRHGLVPRCFLRCSSWSYFDPRRCYVRPSPVCPRHVFLEADKSCDSLATFSSALRVDGTLTSKVQWDLVVFGGAWRWSRRGVVLS